MEERRILTSRTADKEKCVRSGEKHQLRLGAAAFFELREAQEKVRLERSRLMRAGHGSACAREASDEACLASWLGK